MPQIRKSWRRAKIEADGLIAERGVGIRRPGVTRMDTNGIPRAGHIRTRQSQISIVDEHIIVLILAEEKVIAEEMLAD